MYQYEFLDRPGTGCVRFIRTNVSQEDLEADVETARKAGVRFAYWNYLHGGRESATVANPLAIAIGLENVPYGKRAWVQFLDDLITVAYRYDGLVIVVDRADLLIVEKRDEMFDCIEAFMIQFHHSYDQKKPCHLCVQMLQDDIVTNFFTRETRSA